MVKFAVCSDLHLEFGGFSPEEYRTFSKIDSDVLILAGDITTLSDLRSNGEVKKFFDFICRQFEFVVYVFGNHEYYGSDITLRNQFREILDYPNLHMLENESIIVNGVTVFGSTLWTDMNNDCPLTKTLCGMRMNDYRAIRNKGSLLTPENTIQFHREALSTLQETYQNLSTEKLVVVTHHAPHRGSIAARFKEDQHTNGAYVSDLEEVILSMPKIDHWVHGHMHDLFEYTVGETQVLCNPRGYYGIERFADTPYDLYEFRV